MVFFFKKKTAYEIGDRLVGSEICIRDSLTANGSAVATNADSPFGNSGVSTTIDYGIVMAKSFSTNTTLTIQVPEGCTIPTSGGVASMDYSINDVPYGFVRKKDKWSISSLYLSAYTQSSPVNGTWYNLGHKISLPVGAWVFPYHASIQPQKGNNGMSESVTISTTNNGETDSTSSCYYYIGFGGVTSINTIIELKKTLHYDLSSVTPLYMNVKCDDSGQSINLRQSTVMRAENAYI